MSVDVSGRLDVAVPHPFLNVLEGKSIVQQQACAAVAKLMETDMRQAVLLEHLCKMVRHIVGGKWCTVRPLEDVVIGNDEVVDTSITENEVVMIRAMRRADKRALQDALALLELHSN